MINTIKKQLLSFLVFTQTSLTENVPVTSPQINENILLLGNFNAISFYENTNNYNLSLLNNDTSIFLYELSATNQSITVLRDSNLSNSPTLWQTIDDTFSIMVIDNEPFIFNINNATVTEFNGWKDEVDGNIESIFYDYDENIIYIGGSISFNNTYGAIQYDYESEQILSLPFGGFGEDSIVSSIIKYEDSDNIIFGGSFTTIGYPDFLNVTYDAEETNYTIIQNSSNLIDISQKIDILSSDTAATAGDNYKNVICPTTEDNGWKLPNNQLGSWSAVLQNEIIPSKIRLYNSQSGTDGVKSFRVITYPANGIMNMTYVDPNDLQVKYCDAFCPLYLPSDVGSLLSKSNITDDQYYTFTNNNQTVLQLTNQFQDFAFVNSIDVTSFTVEIVEYYGDYAELLGIELSSQGITVYANDTFNQLDTCSTSDSYVISVDSEILGDLPWEPSSVGNYLYAKISSSEISNDEGIRYNVHLPVSGEYSILMYTSGCLADNSCGYRGIVNATVYDSDNKLLSTSLIYQTNEYEKYDVLYTGDLTLKSGDLPIYVEMKLYSALNDENMYVVAENIHLQYIQLELNEITGNISSTTIVEKHGLVNINGIMEYSVSNFSDPDVNYPIGNTSINLLGSTIDNNATINQMIINDTFLIVAGDFESEYGSGIIGLEIEGFNNTSSQIETLGYFSIDGGTDGEILQLYGPANEFIMVGSFDNFNNITTTESSLSIEGSVLYNSLNNSLEALNISNPDKVKQLSGFVYNDTEYLIVSYNESSLETELFDFNENSIFYNSSTFALNITNSLDNSNKDWTLDDENGKSYVLGSIVKFDLAANNIVSIDENDLDAINISSNDSLVSGVYINDTLIAIAGSNIYLVSNTSTSLLSMDLSFDENSQIETTMYYKSNLIFSIFGTASFDGKAINGLASFDMNNTSIKTLNESLSGSILDMTIDPEFGTIIGVGDFSIGDCNTICTFGNDSDSLTIERTVSNISGSLSSVDYYNEYRALFGGNFTFNGENSYLGIYDTYNNTVLNLKELSSQLPGPVEAFVFGNERENNKTLDDIIVMMGSNYIGYFNNSKWISLSDGLELDNFQLNDISLVDSSNNNQSFYNSQLLLLTGRFNVVNYGIVSSAVWDGNTWIPYTITASDLDLNNANVQSVVRLTSMFIYQGTFTSTSTSSYLPTATSTSSATGSIQQKNSTYFTNGQVTGVGCALAVGTLMLLSVGGVLYMIFGGNEEAQLEGLKLTGEDRVIHGENMINFIPAEDVVNLGRDAAAA